MNEFKTSFHNADQGDDTNNDWSDPFLGSNRIRQMITIKFVKIFISRIKSKKKTYTNYMMMVIIIKTWNLISQKEKKDGNKI
ncbi:hypothetical protein DERF_006156 [Dermatophagoides farinae]|uniref:Uncharacterized protein n=1 Tax=Dermatophagoides farinae TaxID=6954 RepID=A0A922I4Y2_DERFA|nr:hypothetical protein DERF_006156 [Dermatophagoides farinae]